MNTTTIKISTDTRDALKKISQGKETYDELLTRLIKLEESNIKIKPLHHGICTGEFIPWFIGTDYFSFFHKPCYEENYRGHCKITATLIDNRGRIVFNLKCRDCGAVDALKTTPHVLSTDREGIDHFYLSPNLRSRIGKHSWDNK